VVSVDRTAKGWQHVTANEKAPRGRGVALHLSRGQIVDAALAIVRDSGVSGLSMRGLAAALDATAAITYHYFPNKSAVLEAVCDVVVDEILLSDDPRQHWRERLITLMLAQNRELLRHPGIARFLVEHHDGPAASRWTEAFLNVLLDGGLTPAAAANAFSLISFYVNPAFLIERPEVSTELTVGSGLQQLSGDEDYPAIRAVRPYLGGKSFTAQYEHGVRTLIESLQLDGRLGHTSSSPEPPGDQQ
jgi:AcrR family transcriptional regulator